jgi:hypothetical protein
MFQSPHSTASRPEDRSTAIRAATAVMNRSFSNCRSVSASPVGKYTLPTVTPAVSTST